MKRCSISKILSGTKFGRWNFALLCCACLSLFPLSAVAQPIDYSYRTIEETVNVKYWKLHHQKGIEIDSSRKYLPRVIFHRPVDFTGASFDSSVSFWRAVFYSTAYFRGTKFKGRAKFVATRFRGRADFEGARFGGDVIFSNATLPNYMDFRNVKDITREIDFTLSKPPFPGGKCHIALAGAEISKIKLNMAFFTLWFPKDTTFGKSSAGKDSIIRIDSTSYDGQLSVYESVLKKLKDDGFMESYEILDIEYRQWKFQHADFGSPVFEGRADFGGTEFKGRAKFVATKFKDRADFGWATFDSSVSFWSAEFYSTAYFGGTKFKGRAEFEGARFGGDVIFSNATLPNYMDFRNVKDITREIDFTLSKRPFSGGKCHIALAGAEISKIKLNMALFKFWFPTDTTFGKSSAGKDSIIRIDSTSYDGQLSVYESVLKKLKDDGFMDSYEILDIEYHRFKYKHGGFFDGYILDTVLRWWNYGYSKERVFVWAIGLWVLFSLLNLIFFYPKLSESVYAITFLERMQDSAYTGIKKWIFYALQVVSYTAIVFFGLKMDVAKFKKGVVREHPRLFVYLMVVYVVGLVCLGFIVNIIFTR